MKNSTPLNHLQTMLTPTVAFVLSFLLNHIIVPSAKKAYKHLSTESFYDELGKLLFKAFYGCIDEYKCLYTPHRDLAEQIKEEIRGREAILTYIFEKKYKENNFLSLLSTDREYQIQFATEIIIEHQISIEKKELLIEVLADCLKYFHISLGNLLNDSEAIKLILDEVTRIHSDTKKIQENLEKHGFKLEEILKLLNEKKEKSERPLQKVKIQFDKWLTYKFYKQEDINYIPNQLFECIITSNDSFEFDKIYVLLTIGKIEAFWVGYLQQKIQENDCDKGWVVSDMEVGDLLRESILEDLDKYTNISCLTLNELYDDLADFQVYFNWLENRVKSLEIDTQKYIALNAEKRNWNPITNRLIDKPIGFIESYIDEKWLDINTKKHISILGEFGTGKTWFALYYAWQQLKRYQRAKKEGSKLPRIPIYIPLRDYVQTNNITKLFEKFFFAQYKTFKSYEAFETLAKANRLLIIFDGFDEMSVEVDEEKIKIDFSELAKAITFGSKVILTCRNEHFNTAKQAQDLLSPSFLSSYNENRIPLPEFEILKLAKLTDEQIKKVLNENSQNPSSMSRILNNKKLMDLAKRPVMIDLILEAEADIAVGKTLDLSRIFLYAIYRKLIKDIDEERTINPIPNKLYFLCEIAWKIISTNNLTLNYKDFPDEIKQLFSQSIEEQQSDFWQYDMLSKTILVPNEKGDFFPAHRSFLEFLVAYKFAAELGVIHEDFLVLARPKKQVKSSKPYIWNEYFSEFLTDSQIVLDCFETMEINTLVNTFGKKPISKEIVEFMYYMIEVDEKVDSIFRKIIEECREKPFDEIGYFASNLITVLTKIKKDFFVDYDLSLLSLNELKTIYIESEFPFHLPKIISNFKGASFYDSNLSKVKLSKYNLRSTNFTKTNLKGAEFSKFQFWNLIYNHNIETLCISGNNTITLINSTNYSVIKTINDSISSNIEFIGDRIFYINKKQILKSINVNSFKIHEEQKLYRIYHDSYIELFDSSTNLFGVIALANTWVLIQGRNYLLIYDLHNQGRKFLPVESYYINEIGNYSFVKAKNLLALSSGQGIEIWNINSLEIIKIIKTEVPRFPKHFQFSPNGEYFAWFNNDTKEINIYQTSIFGKPVYIIESKDTFRTIPFFKPNSKELFLIGTKCIEIYSIPDFEKKSELNYENYSEPHQGPKNVVYDSKNNFLHIHFFDGKIVKFNLVTGKAIDIFWYMPYVENADFTDSKGLDKNLAIQLQKNGAIINPDDYD